MSSSRARPPSRRSARPRRATSRRPVDDVRRERDDRRAAAARARRAAPVEPEAVQQTIAARSSVSAIWRAAAAIASAPVASGSVRCACDDGAVDRVALDLLGDAVHGRDRLDRILPGRRFRRQHDRVGALEDGGGDVGHLGAGRHRSWRSSIPASASRPRPACRRARPARVICFCMPGTFSSGISTPRSPRATISASARSMISSSRVTACGFSILAMTAARPRVIFLASAMSSGRWTKDSATQSTPASSAASRSERSFSVSAENGMVGVGQAHALAVGELAADLDARDDALWPSPR